MKWKNDYCNHINDFTHIECFDGEEWKDIYYEDLRTGELIDYRGLYQVSNLGRVRSLDRITNHKKNSDFTRKIKGRIMIIDNDRKGYCIIHLCKNGKYKTIQLHRIVMLCFNPIKEIKCVNHIDENVVNNTLKNLEWMSVKENTNYGSGKKRMIENQHSRIIMGIKGDEIIIFNSLCEAKRNGFDTKSIVCCIQKRKSYYYHKGYKWFDVHTCKKPNTKKLYEKGDLNE